MGELAWTEKSKPGLELEAKLGAGIGVGAVSFPLPLDLAGMVMVILVDVPWEFGMGGGSFGGFGRGTVGPWRLLAGASASYRAVLVVGGVRTPAVEALGFDVCGVEVGRVFLGRASLAARLLARPGKVGDGAAVAALAYGLAGDVFVDVDDASVGARLLPE